MVWNSESALNHSSRSWLPEHTYVRVNKHTWALSSG